MTEKQRVAVVGLGACGLAALKNLREAGFDAIGFESNAYVGGLWQYSEDPNKTTVLKTTVANLSKRLACYTDFPYADDVADFATAEQTNQYLQSYAKRFGLLEHARLRCKIQHVGRDASGWALSVLEGDKVEASIEHFDKVVMCVGLQVQEPKIPQIKGQESFTGTAVHSNGYKRASDFDGKRVVVVGFGNTGPDTAVDLIGHASNIWLSHRRGNAIFKRYNPKGKPFDYIASLRTTKLGGILSKYFPSLAQKLSISMLKKIQREAFDIEPEWKLGPIPSPTRKVPTMSEQLVPALRAGKLDLKPKLTEINGGRVQFSDGSSLFNVDAIIYCTGFRSDYSFMDPSVDPTRNTRKDWSSLPGANGRPLPRLYQGIFSLDHPDSLAFLGTSPLSPQACLNYDISSTAVAHIWSGKSSLPSARDMSAHVDAQHAAVCEVARTGDLANVNLRNNWDWFKWCDEAAGIGLVKRMGYGFKGWKFWIQDRKLCKMVMDGIVSPHLFRLFDEGKRPLWPEAREAVEKVNKEAGKV